LSEGTGNQKDAARFALALGLTAPSREASRLLRGGGGIVAIFVAFFVVAVVAGGLLVRRQTRVLRERAFGFVSSVAIYRSGLLERWLDERRGDALVASRDPVLARGFDGGAATSAATRRLSLIARAYGYSSLVALDRDGRPRFSHGDAPELLAPDVVARARRAMEATAIDVVGLRPTRGPAPRLAFDLIAPVIDEEAAPGRVAGALLLRVDPERVLVDVLAIAPASSPSGELSLVVGHGRDAVFAYPRRHGTARPMVTAEPPADPRAPEAIAASGATDFSGARDEAGEPLIAFAAPLPGFDATTVGHIQTAELVGEGARALWLTISLLGGAFLGVALLARWGWARRARAALRASEEKFRIIFETMQEGYILSAIEGAILLVNPAAVRMLGYPDEKALLGKSMPDDVFTDPEERRLLRERVLKDGVVQGYKATFKRADGSPVIVEGNVRLIRGEDGQPLGLEGIIRDMSAHYQIRADLIAAREAAETTAQAKSQFLANMSHEIRTPLNAIVGLGHLLLRGDLPARERTYVNQIQASARILLGTVEDVLDFSKIEAGRLELERVPFSLDEVVGNVVSVLGVQAQAKGVALSTSLGGDVPRALVGDPLRLGQVLMNLVGNALKFTRAGEVVVEVAVVERGADDAALRFAVRDTGIGVTAEQLDRIFEPFTQADGSTTRQYGGTGLGLTICRQIVEAMGGKLEASSSPGVGSTFYFAVRLPVRDAAAPRAAETAPGERFAALEVLRGARVLVAEDNAINQEVARELLEGAGLHVTIAVDGRDAVEKVLADPKLELVLMDLQMPRLDGLAATRELRARPELAHLPIVAMTAHALVAERERCLAAGMDDYVSKPFEPADLFSLIARRLAGRGSGREGSRTARA
jgi:PAS domain S-box-containing protein